MPFVTRIGFQTLAFVGAGACVVLIAQGSGWRANPAVVERTAKARGSFFNFEEANVSPYELPNAMEGSAGAVRTRNDWKGRRAEVLDLFREHVYGRSPGKPEKLRFQVLEESKSAMDGAATLKRVAILSTQGGREHKFELRMFLPNAASGPVPVFLVTGHRGAGNFDMTRKQKSGFWPAEEVIARNYGIAAFLASEVAPDDKERFREGAIALFEGASTGGRPGNAWATLAAWAWGASRSLDYFETDSRVDAKRVAIVGHSRGGKAALWAGAEDERFALAISNNSGEGGAALGRRYFGEHLEWINERFPHWFAGNYKGFAGRIDKLPVDQHMLLALMAPRALYVTSADEDLWADPRGEFLSLAHASPVYQLYGEAMIQPGDMPAIDRPLIAGRRAYHVRTGGHDLTPYDWQRFMDFADTLWRGAAPRK